MYNNPLIVAIDLQQLYIEIPIRSSIVGARDFAWLQNPKESRNATRSLSFVGGGWDFKKKTL